jgi:hypothetical protein
MFPVCFTQESTQESAVEWKYVGAWTAAVGLFTAVLSPDEDDGNEGERRPKDSDLLVTWSL